MSPAGRVTGSSKEKGSLDPGGGLRKCLRGTPLERSGATARARRIRSQIPVDCIVCFCIAVSWCRGEAWLRGGIGRWW